MTKIPYDDRLCGVQRNPDVPEYGEVVVPVIWLWESPFRNKVIAVAEHDEPVKVLERYYVGCIFCRVLPDRAVFVGRLRRLRGWLTRTKPSGWVPAVFLKDTAHNSGDTVHDFY